MVGREIVSIATLLVVVALITYAIANGGNTAKVISSAGDSFAGLLRAATQR